MDICQIGYDICEFDSLRGLGIDIIGRVHFDNRDRFSISMGSIGKAIEPFQQTTEWLLTSDFWLLREPWYARWYEYEIFIASCTDSIYDLENERWLFDDMIDHVGIYGSRVAEGLSAFNVGLVGIWYNLYQKFCSTLQWRLDAFTWGKCHRKCSWVHLLGLDELICKYWWVLRSMHCLHIHVILWLMIFLNANNKFSKRGNARYYQRCNDMKPYLLGA